MYVLIHELTHIYDPKFLTGKQAHDEFFWTLMSKLDKRAIELGILSTNIFNN